MRRNTVWKTMQQAHYVHLLQQWQWLPTRTYNLLSHGLSTRFTLPNMNALLWSGRQVQLEKVPLTDLPLLCLSHSISLHSKNHSPLIGPFLVSWALCRHPNVNARIS